MGENARNRRAPDDHPRDDENASCYALPARRPFISKDHARNAAGKAISNGRRILPPWVRSERNHDDGILHDEAFKNGDQVNRTGEYTRCVRHHYLVYSLNPLQLLHEVSSSKIP